MQLYMHPLATSYPLGECRSIHDTMMYGTANTADKQCSGKTAVNSHTNSFVGSVLSTPSFIAIFSRGCNVTGIKSAAVARDLTVS